MRLEKVLTQEEFDSLLSLFADDRDKAGLVYEEIRRNLLRFFEARNCQDSDILADETLFRVASKAHTFDPERHTRPSSFVFGFAAKILLEYSRDPVKMRITYDRWIQTPLAGGLSTTDPGDGDEDLQCLTKCLADMDETDREILLTYYSREKHEKIESRKEMAAELGISIETLHMRVHRLRSTLRKCMRRCKNTERSI
jgi:RNA polymerase sigma factor (sigma-70 family)